jgi:release factor glutamine methyltransferase
MPDGGDRHALLRAAAAGLPGDTARLDAELLLAHALGAARLTMLAGRAPVPAAALAQFEGFIARRRRHEPIAHIVGEREFWSLPLRVTPDVLIPRPDSETLIADALASGVTPARILDLGTGSGALLLAALSEWPDATGLGVDCSGAALAVARGNAERLGFAARAAFAAGDWAEGLAGPFDLILCNPPYIPDGEPLMPDVARYEPAGALFGGPDGLAPYRRLFPEVPRLLAPRGVAIFEFGPGQAGALQALAADAGMATRLAQDLAGRPRCIRLWRRTERHPNSLGNRHTSV